MLGSGKSWRQFHLRDQVQDVVEAVGLCHDSIRAIQLIPERDGPTGVLHPVIPNREISQFFARRPGIYRACSCLTYKKIIASYCKFSWQCTLFLRIRSCDYHRRNQRWAPYLRDFYWLAILERTADNFLVPDAPSADYYSLYGIPFSRLAAICVDNKPCSRRKHDRRRI